MAHFLLTYRYADADARARTRESHLDYLRRLVEQGKLALAGPMTDGDGATVVYVADSLEDAQALVDADPYTAAGVAEGHVLREWNVVVGAAG